jgi:hypothetical protein
MVFSNAYNVYDHINNNIDASVFPEETHHILQGNIGALVAGNSRLHFTEQERPSMLGIVGDVRRPETVIASKTGKAESQSGRMMNVPRSFFDDSTPLFTGESGYGIDWKVLNNPENNIGYALDFNGNRTLGFPYHAVAGTDIGVMPHSPPIELVERNGRIIPSWEPISKAFPGLGTPVGDWTKISHLHNSSLNKI